MTAFLAAATFFIAPTVRADEHKHDLKPYKLDTCIVSDEKLGEHGKPVVMDYQGQEIKLCCKDCIKDFKKEPEKYISKLKAAEKK